RRRPGITDRQRPAARPAGGLLARGDDPPVPRQLNRRSGVTTVTTWQDIKQRLRPFMPADEMRRIIALGPRNERPAPVIDGAEATIRLYDPIDDWGGWWGVSAKELAAVLDALPDDVETINLRVNSPGGLVFEGWTIAN